MRGAFLTAELRAGERVLDLGCGAGEFTALVARAGARAVGIEVAQAALARARGTYPQLDFRWTEIDGPLPLPDTSFELVWASEVIEHVADTARWLSEVVCHVAAEKRRCVVASPFFAAQLCS